MASRLEYLNTKPFIDGKRTFGLTESLDWLTNENIVWRNNVPPDLGNPSDGKFDYPDEDLTSKLVVDARRKAERNFDRYWTYVDNALRKKTVYAQHETIRRIYEEGGPMRRTAPWHTPSEPKDKASIEDRYEYHPLSEVFHDATKQVTGNFDRMAISSRTKEKTRGCATQSDELDTTEDQQSAKAVEKPAFRFDKAAYTVFRTLFYSQNDGELPRNIRWAEVVSALTKLGFSAEKLY